MTRLPATLPSPVECFDGARIIPYELSAIGLSFAFGSVINQPSRRIKFPHFHKEITEYIYVIEGKGVIDLGSGQAQLTAGDWVEIPPGQLHAMRNYNDQHMVVLCLCSPQFDGGDVYYTHE